MLIMAGKKFEDLPVWQDALRLAVRAFEMTDSVHFSARGGVRDQLQRAALSISNNIAEGWERGTKEELITFLYYARGSCAEVRSMFHFLNARAIPDLKDELETLLDLSLSISRQLGGWLESLKNSDDRGHRHRDDASRLADQSSRRRAEFLDKLRTLADSSRKLPPGSNPTEIET